MSISQWGKAVLTLTLLWGCAAQQGAIERPEWAQKEIMWEYAGLTVNTFGSPEYQSDSTNQMQMAEESALQRARQLIANELAKSYLKAKPESGLSETDIQRRIENALGNLVERQGKYDEQRQIWFTQVFMPASRLEKILLEAFNTELELQDNGQFRSVAPAQP